MADGEINQGERRALADMLDATRRQTARLLGVEDVGPPPVEDDTQSDDEEKSS